MMGTVIPHFPNALNHPASWVNFPTLAAVSVILEDGLKSLGVIAYTIFVYVNFDIWNCT